jgi:hypothetical protein
MLSMAEANEQLPFLSFNSFGKLVLSPQAAAHIRTLPAPISIVTIAGPTNTGKSTLLRHLLNPIQSPPRAEHYQPTGHLSILTKPYLIYTEDGKISTALFIDTPGISPSDSPYQTKWLVFVLLLSNCLLFNAKEALASSLPPQLQTLLGKLELLQKSVSTQNDSLFLYLQRDCKEDPSSHSPYFSSKLSFESFLASALTSSNG